MGRKIMCPECKSVLNEDILIQKNSEHTCLVCGASLDGDESDNKHDDKSQSAPKEELIDWYYYKVGKTSHYLDDKYMEDDATSKLVYQFKAPKELEGAKEVLRREYDSEAFAPPEPDDIKHKSPQQLISEGRCPYCGSQNIQLIQKKWSVLTGFRTNAVDRICVNCKHRF